jgi:hypothetical protein
MQVESVMNWREPPRLPYKKPAAAHLTGNPKLAEGLFWFRNKEPDKAFDALEIALLGTPSSAIGHFFFAELLAKKNRFAEAVECLQLATQIQPDNINYQLRLNELLNMRQQLASKVEPRYEPNTRIVFSQGGNADEYLHEGWGKAEPKFTWTTSNRATLRLKMGAMACSGWLLTFLVRPYIPPGRTHQRCQILLNGISLASLAIDKPSEHSVWAPVGIASKDPGEMIFVFELPDAARPIDFEADHTDDRMLGLAFESVTLSHPSPAIQHLIGS